MAGISITKLLIIAVIVILFFGTKKLRNLGSDLGSSIKGFKKAMSDDDAKKDQDADFSPKSLSESEQTSQPEVKHKDKDQV
ncbi:twin-arginine translocase subunit TatE [Tatumella sp. TA1]|uniref:twin-arginine translocase subunit TatE n=1 Tax=Rosenbergiella collisarenosi TaxID=1544695 RepID=UPI0008F8360A|nr:twin-arginine translocase subunit TatE [Rosenbergiella collisarenosi]MBT0721864.1 twin-arginine translocase subunit TatE [Rosenbergiella collisarenosi]QGX92691.1 twin-arginine translocase subunit TatE [Tatumella sp. TA1]